MKKIKGAILVLCIVFAVSLFAACAGGPSADSIEVTTLPDKSVYAIGETFSAEGGELTATMSDGTTATVALTDPAVTLSAVDTSSAGTKYVTVSYGGARVRFTVTVEPITVMFDLGDVGATPIDPMELDEVMSIEDDMPDDPVADGFEFEGWYLDEGFTQTFDPSTEISTDTTIYANWLDVSATYYTVTFSGNYYGAQPATSQRIEEGASANVPARAPTRNGYEFAGWYASAEGGEEYDFGAVTADTTVYAHWTRTMTGTETWTFEGELIDFTGKQGPGYSGTTSGRGMIQTDITGTASGGQYIGFNYRPGMRHDFRFASDRAVSDVTVVLRLSAEFADYVFTPDNLVLSLNGTELDYDDIVLDNVPDEVGAIREFADFTIAVNASLVQGANTFSIIVNNAEPPTDESGSPLGTMLASAPLIDCVKLTTSAALYWDGEYGMPGPLPG